MNPAIKMQKITADDDLKAYLKAFEHTTEVVGWPEA